MVCRENECILVLELDNAGRRFEHAYIPATGIFVRDSRTRQDVSDVDL